MGLGAEFGSAAFLLKEKNMHSGPIDIPCGNTHCCRMQNSIGSQLIKFVSLTVFCLSYRPTGTAAQYLSKIPTPNSPNLNEC